MADASIDGAKTALRNRALALRASLNAGERAEAARAAASHFFQAIPVRSSDVVAGYWRIRDEMDCQPILLPLMNAGQPVALPVVLGGGLPLEMRLWQADTALQAAGFGTLAPPDGAPRAVPDIVIMPLLGFDRFGTRLGYGGGYYDRTLAAMKKQPTLVGLAFAIQEFDHIPREDHDVPLHAIVTENGVRSFGARA